MLISVNSRDRASGSAQDYIVDLDPACPPRTVKAISVVKADVPFPRRLFHESNCAFSLSSAGSASVLYMATGEDYAQESELVADLNSCFTGYVTWSFSSGVLSAQNDTVSDIVLTLTQAQVEILGFTDTSVSIYAGDSVSAQGAPMIEPEDTLFVTVGGYDNVVSSEGNGVCAVLRGPRGDDPADLWSFDAPLRMAPGPIRRVRVAFEDQYGDAYDFGGREHILVIETR